jgi:hypothetical protein
VRLLGVGSSNLPAHEICYLETMELYLHRGIVLLQRVRRSAGHPAQSRSTPLGHGLGSWLALRFGLFTALRRKLSNYGFLQLFDIHAIALGSVIE